MTTPVQEKRYWTHTVGMERVGADYEVYCEDCEWMVSARGDGNAVRAQKRHGEVERDADGKPRPKPRGTVRTRRPIRPPFDPRIDAAYLGMRLFDAKGDPWEWLGDCLPATLPSGRQWLLSTRGPWLRVVNSSVTMPWTDDNPMQSASKRYGPFRLKR